MKYNLVSKHTNEVVHTVDLAGGVGISGARTYFIGDKKLDPKEFDKLFEVKYKVMSKNPIRWWVEEKKIEEYENNKHQVVVTMYHPVSDQTDDTPNITADGSVIKISKASEYRYVAVSRNMLIRYGGFLRYGDYVWVDAGKKSGVYQVRDTMARRWINRIDILETPGVEPYKYNDASLRRLDYVSENL